jgi:hypothetical protein
LLDRLFALRGEQRPSDNLYHCLLRASGGSDRDPKVKGLHLLPRTMANNLDTIRQWANPVRHADLSVPPPTGKDAENMLLLFLRVLEWFYCECSHNPDRLSTIYAARE